jgi:hypothetical protein
MNLEQPPDSELFNTMGLIFFLTIVLASIWGIILWWGVKEARQPHNQFAPPQPTAGLILPYVL